MFFKIRQIINRPNITIPFMMIFSLMISSILFPMPTLLTIYVGQQMFSWGSKKVTNQYNKIRKYFQKPIPKSTRRVRKRKVFLKKNVQN